MRLYLAIVGFLSLLVGCDAFTGPPTSVPTSLLETTLRVSHREVSLSSPPDSVVLRIRVRNTLPYRVVVAPDSSRGTGDDFFIGYGVRWHFQLDRTDAPGSGGSRGGLAWQPIHLGVGDWVDFTYVLRPTDVDWNGYLGVYAIHAVLQGEPLTVQTIRFTP
jgi:hypothetical protein